MVKASPDGQRRGMLAEPLPALEDDEGVRVPGGIPKVLDAHVHLFPPRLFASIWRWFDSYGWPVRYRLKAEDVVGFLLARGVEGIIGLHYAHRPGVARDLNRHMAALSSRFPALRGFATVFPGEPDAADILEEGFRAGLHGLKLHAHVQCFDLGARCMRQLYEVCVAWDRPFIVHAGREPKSPAYRCDPYAICNAGLLERVLRAHPRLRVCVPHLGADEFEAYRRLVQRYETLWLDTTMMLGGYLPGTGVHLLKGLRPDRVIYGTDFPNIPYAWDRELKALLTFGYDRETLGHILGSNAREFCSESGRRRQPL